MSNNKKPDENPEITAKDSKQKTQSSKKPNNAVSNKSIDHEGPFLVLAIEKNRLCEYLITFDYQDVLDMIKNNDEDSPPPNDSKAESPSEKLNDDRSKFAGFIETFAEEIKGFYHLVHITIVVRNSMRKNFITSRVIEFADSDLENIENSGRLRVFRVPDDKYPETIRRVRELGEFLEGTSQLPALLLMGLVARYDAQISSLVRLLLKDRPEAIGSRQSEFDLATVLTFSNIEDLKDLFIDQEVHKLMLSSHHDQVVFLEKTFKIEIRQKVGSYLRFLKVFERRNLVAHGEGLVNSRYDNKCNSYKIPADARLP